MPLVPQVALFSGSARLVGNPWTPGVLVRRMIWLGAPDTSSAEATWRSLFDALAVGDEDDIFARFLQSEVEAWLPQPAWTFIPAPTDSMPLAPDAGTGTFPSRQFVRDLNAVLAANPWPTRSDWAALHESVHLAGPRPHKT